MNRTHAVHWLTEHPDLARGDADTLTRRCERAARNHAVEDAWLLASRAVEARMHRWEHEWGFHASDAYVAREACSLLAHDLRSHEPHPHAGDEDHLLGHELAERLDPAARKALGSWILELADREMHRAWLDIVRYTERRGAELVREGHLRDDLDWDRTGNFKARAAQIARLLARELDAQAHHPHAF